MAHSYFCIRWKRETHLLGQGCLTRAYCSSPHADTRSAWMSIGLGWPLCHPIRFPPRLLCHSPDRAPFNSLVGA
jgi:hypothetical protein